MALTDDIIAYYKLDGDSTDEVGSNDGSDTDITYSEANGKIVQGAGFNGTTSKIALGTPITMPTNLTISAWIKLTVGGNQAIIADGNADSTVRWDFIVRDTGKLMFEWRTDGSNWRTYETDDNVILDTDWHFVCVTQTGTGAPTIYVDGSPVDSTEGSSGAATKPTAQGTALGQLGVRAIYLYTGAIDEVGIWERALESAEITSLWNSGDGFTYPFSEDVTIEPPVMNLDIEMGVPTIATSLTIESPSFNLNIQIGIPTLVLEWGLEIKHTTTWTGGSKNTTTMTEQDKSTAPTWTNIDKS